MHDARERVDSNLCCWSADEIEAARQRSVDHGSKWRRVAGARSAVGRTFSSLPPLRVAAGTTCSLSPPRRPNAMARNTPLCADIIIGREPSALHRPREVVHEEESSSNRDRMGVTSGCLEPAKGTSFRGLLSTMRSSQLHAFGPFSGRLAGFHNGRTGTGNVYARLTPPFDRIHPLPPTPTTRRKMRNSHLVAALPLFASLASAQLIYPNCSSGWDWVSPQYNSSFSPLAPLFHRSADYPQVLQQLESKPLQCCCVYGGDL